jgi:hypothetical protein
MLRAIIESHPDFTALEWEFAEPEARIRFDNLPGEPRNSDLVVRARDTIGSVAISIEAKADETFGSLLGDALADAVDRRTVNPRSGGLRRIEQLVDALLPPKQAGLPDLRALRYQLLTATAGALAWAEQCQSDRAILVIHEFRSSVTNERRQEANHADLNRFIRRIAGADIQDNITPGSLIGPLRVKGEPLFSKPANLYFGLVTTACT